MAEAHIVFIDEPSGTITIQLQAERRVDLLNESDLTPAEKNAQEIFRAITIKVGGNG